MMVKLTPGETSASTWDATPRTRIAQQNQGTTKSSWNNETREVESKSFTFTSIALIRSGFKQIWKHKTLL